MGSAGIILFIYKSGSHLTEALKKRPPTAAARAPKIITAAPNSSPPSMRTQPWKALTIPQKMRKRPEIGFIILWPLPF